MHLTGGEATFSNTLVTGYGEDVFLTDSLDFSFDHCIVRTVIEDTVIVAEKFPSSVLESPKDSVQGIMHFSLIDTDNLVYDFHLDSLSTAIGKAEYRSGILIDRDGNTRSTTTPTIGCYEWIAPEPPAAAPFRAVRRRR